MIWVLIVRLLLWIAAASLAFCVGLHGLRYYELASAGTRTPLRRSHFALRTMSVNIGAFMREWGAWWVLTLIRPFGWGAEITRLAGEGTGRPVVMVPGFLMNRSCMWFVGKRVARSRSEVSILNYRTTADVREVASDLAYHVEDVCKRTGQKHVDIVAYSLGGLVSRYYVDRLGGAARVRRLVTMGSPHRGTKVAVFFGLFPSVKQMRPGSELLADLQAAGLSSDVEYTAVYSDFDAFMLPPDTARLPTPATNVHIDGCGHGGLLLSRRFSQPVLEALSS